MFPAFLQCRTQRPPLLAWMLLTTRGKKFKPYKPEKTAEQKAEAKRAVRSRRRGTARWLNSVTKGDYNLCFTAAVDKQSQSARQRKRQGAAKEDAEQAEAERALWRILFSGRPSAESMREAERAWRRQERERAKQATSGGANERPGSGRAQSGAQERSPGKGGRSAQSERRGGGFRRGGSGGGGGGGGFGGGAFGTFGFASFVDLDHEAFIDLDVDFDAAFFEDPDPDPDPEPRQRRGRARWTWAEFDMGDGGGERTYAEFDLRGARRRARSAFDTDRNADRSNAWAGSGGGGARAGAGGGEGRVRGEGSGGQVAASLRALGLEAGLGLGALTGDLLRSAWRAKALENHPDRHPETAKPAAEARFRQAHDAYVLLQARLAR